MSDLPEWARDPDAVLAKRAKAAQQPSFAQGVALLALFILAVVGYVLDLASWLGGLKSIGWIE